MQTPTTFHPAEGRTCPISGMPITDWICWKSPAPSSNYSYSICRLGNSIIWSKASGYVTLNDMNEAMGLLLNFLTQTKIHGENLVYIEDYSEVKGAHYQARMKYIEAMRPIQDIFTAGVFYGLSPLFKFSYKLYLRFGRPKSQMHLVDNYKDAIIKAISILNGPGKTGMQTGISPPAASEEQTLSSGPPSKKPGNIIYGFIASLYHFFRGGSLRTGHYSARDIERYIQDIQLFISTIDWNRNGIGDYDRFFSPGNPFRSVYDAIGFMKTDMDTVIDQRDKAYDALKVSEERYRHLVEQARAGIYEVDLHKGKFSSVNDTIIEITGYSREELLDQQIIDILSPESVAAYENRMEDIKAGKNLNENIEYKVRCKNGEYRWVLVNARYAFENDELISTSGVVTDITRLKQTEQELIDYRDRLRVLSTRVADTEEKERRKIANYLHDHINQRIAVINMKMGALMNSRTNSEELAEFEKIREMMRSVIQDMRFLTVELSPNVLYELGFNEAVDWLAERATREHGLQTTVHKNEALDNLPEDRRIILFRVISELIHNIVKHAQADEAVIDLGNPREMNKRVIQIRDNGIGLNPDRVWKNSHKDGGFGLFSVREKMFSMGGELEIDSTPNNGTTIRLTFPVIPH